ncbi:MAG TPA: sigma 54-interacting transcriptional regulator [Acidobacteriaceae bacterium]|nr:sigma 54-interacting transcriptional regulator [Acidobacteriaceae bacterium]HWA69102.1 sigma 54-interacting transcriptional regulator [Rhizomicrobium sp.]
MPAANFRHTGGISARNRQDHRYQAARLIHARSRRAGNAFVAINCATMEPNRPEAELFGVESMEGPRKTAASEYGMDVAFVKKVIAQSAVYRGVPAANAALHMVVRLTVQNPG